MENETLKLRKENGIMIISPQTDFTVSFEEEMEDIYLDLCEMNCEKILIEFFPENHISSGGMAVLINIVQMCKQKEQEIGITGLSEHFKKIFMMIGLTRHITIYNSTEEALQEMSQTMSYEVS